MCSLSSMKLGRVMCRLVTALTDHSCSTDRSCDHVLQLLGLFHSNFGKACLHGHHVVHRGIVIGPFSSRKGEFFKLYSNSLGKNHMWDWFPAVHLLLAFLKKKISFVIKLSHPDCDSITMRGMTVSHMIMWCIKWLYTCSCIIIALGTKYI